MNNHIAIQVQDLRKSYREVQAVQGMSFDVPQGEIFGLLGPNGAGKSTTISMLSGLVRPTAGDVLVMGHSILREPLQAKSARVQFRRILRFTKTSRRLLLHHPHFRHPRATPPRADRHAHVAGQTRRSAPAVETRRHDSN